MHGRQGASAAGAPDGSTTAQVWLGIRTSLPVAAAVAGIGIAFGVLVARSGLEWWWATVFASVIFAGSLEFVLLGLVVSLAPLSAVAATTLLVNVRHVFYALSFPLHRVHGVGAKLYSTFALTDEAYALTSTPQAQHWSRARILSLQAAIHVYWVGSVTIGAAAGSLIPHWISGLDFAVTALFTVLAIEAFRVRRSVPLVLAAVVCAIVGRALAGNDMPPVAFAAFVMVLTVQYAWRRWRGRAGTGADGGAADA